MARQTLLTVAVAVVVRLLPFQLVVPVAVVMR
jgi:hypothetical protein